MSRISVLRLDCLFLHVLFPFDILLLFQSGRRQSEGIRCSFATVSFPNIDRFNLLVTSAFSLNGNPALLLDLEQFITSCLHTDNEIEGERTNSRWRVTDLGRSRQRTGRIFLFAAAIRATTFLVFQCSLLT